MAKKNKYAFGGTITPEEMIIDNKRMWAEANVEAQNDPLVQTLGIVSDLMGTAGNMMLNKGMSKMAYGGNVPVPAKRVGQRRNEDGTYSTHLYEWGEVDDGYVVYPTLFQNEAGEFYTVHPDSTYSEAKKRNEVIFFKNKRDASKYAKSSWKKYYNADGTPIQRKKKAYGGLSDNIPIEVEGDEMAELPNGMMLDFEGPTHEQGGIPVDVPEGTKIYSNRILVGNKTTGYKTMSRRKWDREKKIKDLEKKADKGDIIAKKTLDRYMLTAGKEEELDMGIQELLNNQEQKFDREKYPFGTGLDGIDPTMKMLLPNAFQKGVGWKQQPFTLGEAPKYTLGKVDNTKPTLANLSTFDFKNNTTVPTTAKISKATTVQEPVNKFNLGEILPYVGDAIGIIGNIGAGIANQKAVDNYKANRRLEVNHFKDFGKKGLETLDSSKKYVRQMGEMSRNDIEGQRLKATTANRQSARGVNTMRALDLATQEQANRMDLQSYIQEAAMLQQILNQQAQMENVQDQMVMTGEGARDMRERDTDANINNMQLRADLAKANALSHTGKSLNDILERNATIKAMNNAYSNFKTNAVGDLLPIPENVPYINLVSRIRKNPTQYGFTKEELDGMNEPQILQEASKRNLLNLA